VAFWDNGVRNPMIKEADAIVEYEVLKNTVVSASYLNSQGRGLLNFLDTNLPTTYQNTNTFTLPSGTTFTIPSYGTLPRPNASFNQMTKITNAVDSDYNAFVVQVTRRLTAGLQFQSSYTYSKATDNGQNSVTFTTSNNALDPANPKQEFGRSNFDVPHKFVFAGIWQPNFFKNSNKGLHYILDDWSLAPIVNLSSGFAYTGSISGSLPATNANPATPAVTVANCAGSHSSGINCAVPSPNRIPSVDKNSFRSPSRDIVDFRTSRKFVVREKWNVEFLAEAFNLFNHPNVSGMNTGQYNVGSCTGNTGAPGLVGNLSCALTNNATFGTPSTIDGGTNLRERQIQFGLRFEF